MFFWASSTGMFLLIAVASCTSREVFGEVYMMVAEFLSLSKTSLSMFLRTSPGLGHFLCYALLSFSLPGVFSRRNIFIAPMVAVLFGVIMEFVQSFIPSRDASLMDIGINFFGVVLGFGVYILWVTHVRSSDKPRLG
jgi:VanZ family protein